VGNLKSGKQVDFYDWHNSDIASYCEMYISFGWCKRYKDNIWQYEAFQEAVRSVELKIKIILDRIIDKVPGLKQFMIIHSVFGIHDNVSSDWLVRYMINKLYPTDEEVEKAHEKDHVPEEIMDQLKIFDPMLLGFEKNCYNIRLEYKMWGNSQKKESIYPLTIINRSWEIIEIEIKRIKDAKAFLSQFKAIDL